MSSGAGGIVILWGQFGNGTGRFGHPVHLNMGTFQRSHRRHQYFVGDWRSPVHNGAHRGIIAVCSTGNHGHERQKRWNEKRVRGFVVTDEIKQNIGERITDQQRFCANKQAR